MKVIKQNVSNFRTGMRYSWPVNEPLPTYDEMIELMRKHQLMFPDMDVYKEGDMVYFTETVEIRAETDKVVVLEGDPR